MNNIIQIVGGNSDIAFSTSKIFAKNGYDIHLVSKNFKNLKIKKDKLENNFNIQCKITELGIENENDVKLFFEKEKDHVSIVLMAVGYYEKEQKNYDKIINLNHKSLIFYIEKAIERYSNYENFKTIIGISSVAADRKDNKNNVYSSSKADFTNYLNKLRLRLYEKQIDVMIIKPGYVKTKMTASLNLPSFLVSTPDRIGEIIFNSFKNNKENVYAPGYWRYIMLIYKNIPQFIFKLFLIFKR